MKRSIIFAIAGCFVAGAAWAVPPGHPPHHMGPGPGPMRMRTTITVWGMVRMAPRRITTHFVAGRRRRVCAVGGEGLRRIHITGVAGMGRSGMMPTGIRTTAPRL